MGRVKPKSVFEYVQNVLIHIILCRLIWVFDILKCPKTHGSAQVVFVSKESIAFFTSVR